MATIRDGSAARGRTATAAGGLAETLDGVRRAVRRKWERFLVFAVLLVSALVMVAPFVWIISSSLKSTLQVFLYPPVWIPNPARFYNYVEVFIIKPFHLYIRNTVFIALMREIAVLWSASFCAYGFSRLRFPGRDFWFSIVLGTMMLPGVVLIVPTFVIFSRLGWIDTYLPLIVPAFFGGSAFYIFLFTQFFRTLPEELADAARIDGCGEFAIYGRIILPLAKPALATVAVFTFLAAWNEFMGPLLYLNTSDKYTVAIGLALFQASLQYQQNRWELIMAASVIMTFPVLVLFFLAQRYFVQGIVMTGLKG